MARVRIYNYTYVPGAANNTKVIVPGKIDLSNILVITNVTRNEIIYNFSDSVRGIVSAVYTPPAEANTGTSTVPGIQPWDGYTTLTLKVATTGHSASDKLSIYTEEIYSAVRMLPAETYVDPANKFRISTPQSLIDTDFELGLQPTKWEFLQGHNNLPSYYIRPSDSPLTPILGGMGFTLLNQSISVTGNVATISGLSLPQAPSEGSFVYVVENNNLANFTNVRFSVLPGATTSQVQFFSSATNGTYTGACVVFGGVIPTQGSFGAGSFVVLGVSNDISAVGANLTANSPINVSESLNEIAADGTFFLLGSNTASRSFFYKAKSLFTATNDLVKLGSTTVYSGQIFNTNVIGSALRIFSVTSTSASPREITVNCLQGHGLYPGAPVFISNLQGVGLNAQGSFTVASCPTEFTFTYYIPAATSAGAVSTANTNSNTVVGSNVLKFASAPNPAIGSTVTGANIPAGSFVVGTFNSGLFVRINQPVTQLVASSTTISFTPVLSQASPATQIFVRPEGTQLHRSTDGGVQISPGTNNLFDYALRQTRRYFRYQSGKGIQFSTASLFKPSYDVTSISVSGTTATFTTDQDHGLQPGSMVFISGVASSVASENNLFNRAHVVAGTPAITPKTFTLTLTGTPTDTNPGGDAQVTVGQSSGSTTRLGLFDDTNGFFWEFDGQGFFAVRRNSTTVLRGSINILTGSSLITGVNTKFTRQLNQGDKLVVRGQVYIVKAVSSDTSVHVSPFYRAATPSTNLGNNGVPYSQITTYSGQANGGSQIAWINMSASTTLATVTPTGSAGGNNVYQFNLSSSAGVVAGQHVSGTNIPAGTFVSSIVGNTVTITNAMTGGASGAYTFGGIPGVAGAIAQPASVIALNTGLNISPGMTIVGTGIPSNTTVVSVSGNSISITPPISNSVANGTAITFVGNSQATSALLRLNSISVSSGATTVQFSSANPGLTDIRPGLMLSGSMSVSPNTVITSWNPTTNTATLSSPLGDAIGSGSSLTITNTASSGAITLSATHGLQIGQLVHLSGTSIGGLVTNRYYYVTSVPSASQFTLSTVPGGTNVTLSTASSGNITVLPALAVGSRISVANAQNVAFNDVHPVAVQSKEIRVACSNTTVTSNVVTCSSTASLFEGMPVTFTGSTFGNITANTLFFIRDIISATTFTLNSSPTSGVFGLSNGSGTMILQSTAIGYTLEQTITGGTYHTSATTKVFAEDAAVRATKVVETRVASTNFNIDRLDGTGPSNYTIDTNKIQMVYIDYTWYGAGFIRWGIRAKDGDIMYCHKMQHNNNEVQAYLRSGNLPGRFEVANNPKETRLTTAIPTSGFTTASPGNIDVASAANFFVPIGTVTNGEVLIDGEFFAYADVTANASNTSPWFNGASAPVVATATCTVVDSKIATVTIGAQGAQYSNEPPIMVKGGGGFGAQFKAVLNGGQIVEVEIINPGFGYTSAPTLVIGPNRLTGCVREASYVTATAGITNASTTVGSNVVTLASANSNFKAGQIIVPPITQFNFITPLRITGIASPTSIFVDQPATVAGSGSVTLPVARKGTAEAIHTAYTTSTPASTVFCATQNCTPTMQHWGVSAIMDGRFDSDKSYVFTTPRSTASVIAPNQTAPILSIRIAPSVEASIARNFGIRNVINRMQLLLNSLGIYSQGAFLISVRLNATSTSFTPANWQAQAVGSGSLSQVIYHNPGDIIVGGDVIFALYASAAGGTNFTVTAADLSRVKDLGHSIIGGDGTYPDGPDVITITAQNLSAATSGVLFARLSWEEAQA